MKQNTFFQLLFELASGVRNIGIPKFRSIVFRLFNKLSSIINSNNYFITYKIGNYNLLMPINHRLPWTFQKYPFYSRNLSRINQYIFSLKGAHTIIDIGANIGDSAFLFRETNNIDKIICVEGNPDYLPLLKKNTNQLGGVQCVNSFVGQYNEDKKGELVSDGRGTAFIQDSKTGQLIRYITLEDVIIESKTTEVGLLKIDTDGYDCQIIKGNIETIKKFKPILFFEYAPAWFPDGKDSQYDIFQFLALNNYSYFIFYSGDGNYLISCTIDELNIISKEMHFYLSLSDRFGDITAFHSEDSELFNYSVSEEKRFFTNYYKSG